MNRPGDRRREQTALDRAALSIEKLMGADRVQRDRPIGELTTYRVGGAASIFVEIGRVSDLEMVAAAIKGEPIPVLVLGRGSNMLVSDGGFPGLVLSIGAGLACLDVVGERVVAGAGLPMPQLARRTAAAGLSGLQWGVGIPGSVGGAVTMNAGCHGSDMASVLSHAEVFSLASAEMRLLSSEDLGYGYRSSEISGLDVVVSASFDLDRSDSGRMRAEIAEIVSWRRQNQPGGSNAGSVFRNPIAASAGELVETAGLKGESIGGASVSSKHANFIQCDEGGSAADVRQLIELVRKRVHERHGVWLELELRLIGFDDLSGAAGGPVLDITPVEGALTGASGKDGANTEGEGEGEGAGAVGHWQ